MPLCLSWGWRQPYSECFFLPRGLRNSPFCQLAYTPFSYTYDYLISLGPGQSVSTGSPVTAGSDNVGPIHVTLLQVADDATPDFPVANFEAYIRATKSA